MKGLRKWEGSSSSSLIAASATDGMADGVVVGSGAAATAETTATRRVGGRPRPLLATAGGVITAATVGDNR